VLTFRRNLAALLGTVALIGSVFLSGGVAHAQPYPPGTTVPECVAGDINAGTLAIGQTAVFVLCGPFADGATVNVTVNGTFVFTKVAASGKVQVTVTRISATTVAVGDPVNVATVCGTNTVVATGPSQSGSTVSADGFFNIQCAPTTTTSTGGLAFTGANVLLAVAVALVLIVLGVLLVSFQRRRRQSF
jgi:hypothetical protein